MKKRLGIFNGWNLFYFLLILSTVPFILWIAGAKLFILLISSLLALGLGYWIVQLRGKVQQLSQSNMLMRDLLDSIPADIIIIDKNYRHLFVNKHAVKNPEVRNWMIGRTLEEYCQYRNKPVSMVRERQSYMKKAVQTLSDIEWEESLGTGNKKQHFIRRLIPIFNQKNTLKFIVGYGLEITKLKKAEARAQMGEAVQTAINYFSTSLYNQNTEDDILWDITQNCITYLDFVDCVVYMHDKERDVLVQKAAFGHKKNEEGQIHNPIEIPMGKGIVGSVALSQKAELITDTTKDPRYIVDDEARFSEIAVPIIGPEGLMGVIDAEHPQKGFFQAHHLDILNTIASLCANKLIKARADKAMVEAKNKAEAATIEKSRFLSTMSHEIRTPLNAVIGLTHLMQEDNPAKSQKQNLQVLQFSANHLLSLINDVLDFSKIDSGHFEFERSAFDLNYLLNNIHQTFGIKAQEKQLQFTLQQKAELDHMVVGDPVRLSQILTNLVGNALKFTQSGSICIQCTVAQEDESEISLRFIVKDTGIGIPVNSQQNIFGSFIQARSDTSRKYGGTGLGLAICKKLVELQGGQIGLNSVPGEGSEFWFCLPFEKTDIPLPKWEKLSGLSWNNQDLKGMRILLVEDNELNVMVAEEFLKKWNIRPDIALNGKIAVEKVKHCHYDLILMDLNMPVMNGIEATSCIRKMDGPYYKRVPIVALTADASTQIKDEVLNNGMDAYLTKPFNPNTLLEVLLRYYQLNAA